MRQFYLNHVYIIVRLTWFLDSHIAFNKFYKLNGSCHDNEIMIGHTETSYNPVVYWHTVGPLSHQNAGKLFTKTSMKWLYQIRHNSIRNLSVLALLYNLHNFSNIDCHFKRVLLCVGPVGINHVILYMSLNLLILAKIYN